MKDGGAKKKILSKLAEAMRPLAVHELIIFGVSENSVSARLRELRATNHVQAQTRPGKAFKEWGLVAWPARVWQANTPAAPAAAHAQI